MNKIFKIFLAITVISLLLFIYITYKDIQFRDNPLPLGRYKHGKIKIELNKKRFQENENYMINYVLPHEYAHALMFYFGKFEEENGGHTTLWQKFCFDVGGIKCDRFVDHNDILIEKIGTIY